MKYEKWRFRVSLTLNVLVVLLFAMCCCLILYAVLGNWHKRQLIPFKATGWQLEASTHTGQPLSVKPYKTRGQGPEGERFYLRIVGGDDTPLSRWFTLDFSDEDLGVIVRDTPIHTSSSPRLVNWHPGLDITNPKLEEGTWWFSYTGDKMVFSNQVFFVSATQENSGRPPVEMHRSTGDTWK